MKTRGEGRVNEEQGRRERKRKLVPLRVKNREVNPKFPDIKNRYQPKVL